MILGLCWLAAVALASGLVARAQRKALDARAASMWAAHEQRMRNQYLDAGERMRSLCASYGQEAPDKYYRAPYV